MSLDFQKPGHQKLLLKLHERQSSQLREETANLVERNMLSEVLWVLEDTEAHLTLGNLDTLNARIDVFVLSLVLSA